MKWEVVLFSLQELKLRRWHWWTAWQLIYTSWWWETNTSVSIQRKKTQLEEKQTLKKTQNDSLCLYSAAFLLQTNSSSPQNPPGRQSLSFRPRELTYTCLNRHIKHPVSMKSFFLLLEFLSHKSSFYFLVVALLHFDSSSDKKRESQRSPDVKSWWSDTETTNEHDSCLLSCPQYAVESQIQLRGFDPQESMLLLKARPVQEQTVHTQFGCFSVS